MRLDDLNEQIADLSPAKRALLELRLKQTNRETPRGPAIPRRAKQDSAPLSFAQQRLWFLNELQPGNPAYHISHAFRIRGALNVSALQGALNEIVRRHEVLRTRFTTVDGQGIQLIDDYSAVSLPIIDVSPVPDVETGIRTVCAELSKLPFDLSAGPLFRGYLCRVNSEDHVLLTTIHHLISDGWSIRVLFRELSALYEAIANGRSSPLGDLPVQYADFALWQREPRQSERFESQIGYWRKKLQGVPALLELPADKPRPAVSSFRGAKKSAELSQSLTSALTELSRREGVTLFMILTAAFKTLLWRYTGSHDLVVGVPVAGRNQPELEGLIGFFVNSVLLRTDLSGDPEFLQLLRRVRETTLEAFANQDVPFERLVEMLQPERSFSHSPLFQVMLTLQHERAGKLELNGLQVESVSLDNETSKFDLTIFALENDERLKLTFEYNTDLFDAERIERMAEHFQMLLTSIVANPNTKLSALELLLPAERQRVLVDWNWTTVNIPATCLHQLFEEQAIRNPKGIAVVHKHERLTYGELNARANQLAHYLRAKGAGPEHLVGICVERSLEMIVGLLGILKAGAAYVPLDPHYPADRLRFMLEDANAQLVLTQKSLLNLIPESPVPVFCLDTDWPIVSKLRDDNPTATTAAENLAYIIYTSGSTGWPKGVAIQHRSALALVTWAREVFSEEELSGVLASTSICFDLSVFELFVPLSCGGTVLVAQNLLHLPSLPSAKDVVLINTVPSAMVELLRLNGIPKTVQTVNLAGEPLSADLVQKLYEHPHIRKVNDLYGPSEDTTYSTWTLRQRGGPATIGRPVWGTRAYLLDNNLRPVPVGVPGELYLGGAGLARGYLNRPELTAQSFIPDRFSGEFGARLYKTGDLARFRSDGNIEYLGRTDSQLKLRGFRIELKEIEAVFRTHPQITETAVVAHEVEPGDRRLVAYVVCQKPGVNTRDLQAHLRKSLPEFMLPAAIVELEELPLTPNGKIDRRALPAPVQLRSDLETVFQGPRTPAEEVLAALWSEILRVDSIGIHDNFFHLGGHSLLAVQVISRIQATFNTELPLPLFFESPTIAACAEKIEECMRDQLELKAAPLVRASREKDLPLSFAQQRLWFLDQLEQGSSFYHISRAFRFRGPLNIKALSEAVNEIVRRHEPLRTSFVSVDGTPIQRIEEPRPIVIEPFDLRQVPENDRDDEVRQLAGKRIRESFDLTRSPLLRTTLIRTDDEEWVFVLTIHHITGDAWSLSILFRELTVLYAAFAQNKVSPLPDLEIQFADVAAWQRSWLDDEILDKHISYWEQQLAGAPLVLELPSDKPRPPKQTFRGARLRFSLPSELTAHLKKLSTQEGVTVFMTFLAGFQVLLSRYTQQTDFIVGTDVANRTRVETEGMIGFFVNVLPLRANLSENPTFRNLLRQVRETTLRSYAHQDVPFEKLVARLKPKRDLSRNALVQVLLVMQNTPQHELELQGVMVTPFEIPAESSRFDLALFLWERDNSFCGSYLYNPDIFDVRTIEGMSVHFETLLKSILENPASRIDSLRMKTEEELLKEELEKRERHQSQSHSLKEMRRRRIEF